MPMTAVRGPSDVAMRRLTSGAVIALAALTLAGCGAPTGAARDPRGGAATPSGPSNILWIIAATDTPAIARLAAEGVSVTHAVVEAPGRAAGRAALLTGMHPAAIGAHLAPVAAVPPPHVRSVPEMLRAAGYFTTFTTPDPDTAALGDAFRPPPRHDAAPGADRVPLGSWDRVGADAHWREREGRQPFFAVIDLTGEAGGRRDADERIMQAVAALESDDLTDDTVVFAFAEPTRPAPSDAAARGETDVRIPLVVRWPRRIAPGTVRDDRVSTVDFAATLLALAGVPVPDHLPGRAFLGDVPIGGPAPAGRAATTRPAPGDRTATTGETPRVQPDGPHPVAARPESYPRGGLFHVAPEVSITCATEGAAIEYTTDRYPPFRWKLYTGPFRIVDWQLRFRCGRLGYHDSETVNYDFDVEFNWWEPRPRRQS